MYTEMLISKRSPRRSGVNLSNVFIFARRPVHLNCFFISASSSSRFSASTFLFSCSVAALLVYLCNNNTVQFSLLFRPNGVIVGAQATAKYIRAFGLREPSRQTRRAVRTPRDVVCGRARQLQVSACERDCVEWLRRTAASMGAIVFVRPLNA